MKRFLTIVSSVALLGQTALVGLLLVGILPSVIGWESYVVNVATMEPALQRGDLTVVAPVRVDQLRQHDVIVYRTPEDPATAYIRRLGSMTPDTAGRLSVQTSADAMPGSEVVLAAPDAVVGRIELAIPHLGMLVEFVSQPLGRVVLLVLPGVLLGLDALRARLRRSNTVPAVPDAHRMRALLASGQRALEAGHAPLAMRAADGVLVLSPGNAAAWHLKARALATLKVTQEHVAA